MNIMWIHSGISDKGFSWDGGETIDPVSGQLLESVIGHDNFKQIWWLEKAVDASKHVARVKLPLGSATGFLVNSNMFMTNNHVFESKNDAKNAILQFNYRMSITNNPAQIDEWECDPDVYFKTNPILDYSIVKIKPKDGQFAQDVWGFFDLTKDSEIRQNQRVNIIQHPKGRFKEIAFRDNQVKTITDNYIQYLTDTDYGSSGSPVLDDWFNIVALHNQRVQDPRSPYRWYRNQGFRIQAIVADVGPNILS